MSSVSKANVSWRFLIVFKSSDLKKINQFFNRYVGETGKLKKEEKSDIFPNHFKEGVDDSESKPHTSESKPSSHSPRRVKTPFMGSDGTSQFELERRHYHVNEVLKEKLREGKKNSSLEFVETCEEFLKELSDPQSLLSTATVDKIEKFLSINTDEEGDPDDNCDKSKGNHSDSAKRP